MGAAIRIDQSVHAEIAVVRHLAEVAAVGVVRVGQGGFAGRHRVVDELPDATAHEVVVRIDQIPVVLKTSGTVAHGVRVFTQEQGLVKHRPVEIGCLNLLRRGVHSAFDVNMRTPQGTADLPVGFSLHVAVQPVGIPAGYVLAVDEIVPVAAVQILRHFVLVAPDTGLVAQRPHQHRGMVLVPLIHPPDAIQVGILPFRIIGQPIPVADGCHAVAL